MLAVLPTMLLIDPLQLVMDALSAHTTMSKQALDSVKVRQGLKSILLGPAGLSEALRERL